MIDLLHGGEMIVIWCNVEQNSILTELPKRAIRGRCRRFLNVSPASMTRIMQIVLKHNVAFLMVTDGWKAIIPTV